MNRKNVLVLIGLSVAMLLAACNTTPAPEETPSNPDNQTLAPMSGALAGNTSISTSYSWVSRGLLYNTNANDSVTGYRLDCSGFVSMAWGLTNAGGGPSTQGIFDSYSIRVSRENLVPGDALDYPPGGAAGHIILFLGWTNISTLDFAFRDFYSTGIPVRTGTARLEDTATPGRYKIVYTGATGSGYMKSGVAFYALRNKAFQPFADGTVVREVSRPQVYVLHGGVKYWVASEAILNTYFGGFANVRVVADGTLARMTEMPDGILARETGSPYVYYISGNYRYWVNSEAKLNTYYGGFNNVRVVPNGALAGITYNGIAAPI